MSSLPEVGTGFRTPPEEEVKPAARAARKRQGMGICLSGGGYRATLFHLGAARRLHELGILKQVDTISSVSGGSLFAGILADTAIRAGWRDGLAIGDFEQQVAKPVRELTSRDLRTWPFLVHLGWNWLLPFPRARHLQWMLSRHMSKARLGDLPPRPGFQICATDLTHGVAWMSSRDKSGSWRAGSYPDAPKWPLAWAVAASACFPPTFGPIRVRKSSKGGPRVHLSDGGVYDNMGLEPVWKSHACVLVSDGGAPFQARSDRTPLRRLLRYTTVALKQAHSLRLRMHFDALDEQDYTGTLWGIGERDREPDAGYPNDVRRVIAKVRTDLDRFTEAEQKILENHGYWAAEEQVTLRLPSLVAGDAPAATAPHPEWMDASKVRRALRRSHRRFSPVRMLRRP